jgi:hypothetical protein
MLCSLSTKLRDEELAEIRVLEKELGVTMLAFSCRPADPAEIDDRQLTSIKELEEKSGVSLVAVIH